MREEQFIWIGGRRAAQHGVEPTRLSRRLAGVAGPANEVALCGLLPDPPRGSR